MKNKKYTQKKWPKQKRRTTNQTIQNIKNQDFKNEIQNKNI